jgi:hypothetical protein
MTRTRLIVGLITHIVIYLTVTKYVREAKARLWAVAPLMMMYKYRTNNHISLYGATVKGKHVIKLNQLEFILN